MKLRDIPNDVLVFINGKYYDLSQVVPKDGYRNCFEPVLKATVDFVKVKDGKKIRLK